MFAGVNLCIHRGRSNCGCLRQTSGRAERAADVKFDNPGKKYLYASVVLADLVAAHRMQRDSLTGRGSS